jgi:hypothetical protein
MADRRDASPELEYTVRTGMIVGVLTGLVVALATAYISFTYLKQPQIPLDWAALVFSALTTGLVAFFVVWGHFQKDPEPGPQEKP